MINILHTVILSRQCLSLLLFIEKTCVPNYSCVKRLKKDTDIRNTTLIIGHHDREQLTKKTKVLYMVVNRAYGQVPDIGVSAFLWAIQITLDQGRIYEIALLFRLNKK